MEYSFFKAASAHSSPGEIKYIYLIPLSIEKKAYGVICPQDFESHILEPGYYADLQIKQYNGCPPEAVENLRQYLQKRVLKAVDQHNSSLAMLRLLGLILICLGIVDFFLPDPLVLLDELLILVGGGVMTFNWLRSRKNVARFLADFKEIKEQITKLPVQDDALCSAIFNSIQARDESYIKNLALDSVADPFELESNWFVKFLNIEDLIKQDKRVLVDLQNIVCGVRSIVPLKKLQQVEAKIQRALKRGKRIHPLVKRLETEKQRTAVHTGFTGDALTVYSALARALEGYESTVWD